MADRRRHAETTRVPVAQSRSEIDQLLRVWLCDGVRWTDHFNEGRAVLEFVWPHDGAKYMARFVLVLSDEGDADQEFRRLHRVLRVYLMAQFNAVESGLVSVEEVFLSHIVGPNDLTVGQQLVAQLPKLIGTSAAMLLPARVE